MSFTGSPTRSVYRLSPTRSVYRVAALVRRCMEGLAPTYLREQCCPTVTIERHISLRSSAQAELLVPRSRTVIRQRRAFSVADPTAWNGLETIKG